ncbi:MAG: flagellar motor switch protein FliG, partial [Desulfobacteraceae bacterium]|nr:flagellar motor switch protein FliG [Desulfobacteraceae bacterium]
MVDKLDPENITGVQKVAIFLLTMGEDYTLKVFERMNDESMSEIGVAMSRIDHITPEMLKSVSLDYIERFEGETKIIVEGEDFLKKIISGSMDKEKA